MEQPLGDDHRRGAAGRDPTGVGGREGAGDERQVAPVGPVDLEVVEVVVDRGQAVGGDHQQHPAGHVGAARVRALGRGEEHQQREACRGRAETMALDAAPRAAGRLGRRARPAQCSPLSTLVTAISNPPTNPTTPPRTPRTAAAVVAAGRLPVA